MEVYLEQVKLDQLNIDYQIEQNNIVREANLMNLSQNEIVDKLEQHRISFESTSSPYDQNNFKIDELRPIEQLNFPNKINEIRNINPLDKYSKDLINKSKKLYGEEIKNIQNMDTSYDYNNGLINKRNNLITPDMINSKKLKKVSTNNTKKPFSKLGEITPEMINSIKSNLNKSGTNTYKKKNILSPFQIELQKKIDEQNNRKKKISNDKINEIRPIETLGELKYQNNLINKMNNELNQIEREKINMEEEDINAYKPNEDDKNYILKLIKKNKLTNTQIISALENLGIKANKKDSRNILINKIYDNNIKLDDFITLIKNYAIKNLVNKQDNINILREKNDMKKEDIMKFQKKQNKINIKKEKKNMKKEDINVYKPYENIDDIINNISNKSIDISNIKNKLRNNNKGTLLKLLKKLNNKTTLNNFSTKNDILYELSSIMYNK